MACLFRVFPQHYRAKRAELPASVAFFCCLRENLSHNPPFSGAKNVNLSRPGPHSEGDLQTSKGNLRQSAEQRRKEAGATKDYATCLTFETGACHITLPLACHEATKKHWNRMTMTSTAFLKGVCPMKRLALVALSTLVLGLCITSAFAQNNMPKLVRDTYGGFVQDKATGKLKFVQHTTVFTHKPARKRIYSKKAAHAARKQDKQ